VAVFGDVVLAGLFSVVCGVVEVAFRHVSVVCGLFMVTSFIVFRGFAMGAPWHLGTGASLLHSNSGCPSFL
jgi:hypothetical protein